MNWKLFKGKRIEENGNILDGRNSQLPPTLAFFFSTVTSETHLSMFGFQCRSGTSKSPVTLV